MSKKTPSKGPTRARTRKSLNSTKTTPTTPIQFNWRKHWDKKVKPHLHNPFVEFARDLGLKMADPTWNLGDPPYRAGRDWPQRPKKGKLTWYQPFGQCHGISFFAMVIGLINYPELQWRFVSGRFHTVPVGYDLNGNAQVVMDILWFDCSTAEESIEFALKQEHAGWQREFAFFETDMAAAIREAFAQNYSAENCERLLNACLAKVCETAATQADTAKS